MYNLAAKGTAKMNYGIKKTSLLPKPLLTGGLANSAADR